MEFVEFPTLNFFAERRYRKKIYSYHTSDRHVLWIFTMHAVVSGVQSPNTNAVAHRLQCNGLGQIKANLDLRVINLLCTKTLALQVTPETNFEGIVLLTPLTVNLGV